MRNGWILDTILVSARRHGINEYDDLVDLLDRRSDLHSEAELFELLPDRWKLQIITPTGTLDDYLSIHAGAGVITT